MTDKTTEGLERVRPRLMSGPSQGANMLCDDEGEYVRYEDVAAALSLEREAREKAEKLARQEKNRRVDLVGELNLTNGALSSARVRVEKAESALATLQAHVSGVVAELKNYALREAEEAREACPRCGVTRRQGEMPFSVVPCPGCSAPSTEAGEEGAEQLTPEECRELFSLWLCHGMRPPEIWEGHPAYTGAMKLVALPTLPVSPQLSEEACEHCLGTGQKIKGVPVDSEVVGDWPDEIQIETTKGHHAGPQFIHRSAIRRTPVYAGQELRRYVLAITPLPRQGLGEVDRLADTLEEWGAGNADMSTEEGDVSDERYKAFQMSAELIRATLTQPAVDPAPSPSGLEQLLANEIVRDITNAAIDAFREQQAAGAWGVFAGKLYESYAPERDAVRRVLGHEIKRLREGAETAEVLLKPRQEFVEAVAKFGCKGMQRQPYPCSQLPGYSHELWCVGCLAQEILDA